MAKQSSNQDENAVSRDRLADLLNENLSREYQAIISYVVYSQVLKGAEYMSIADQLETHAQQELTERHLVRTRFVRVATSFQARGDPILLWAVPFNRQGYLLKNRSASSMTY
jgi:bacterioferritin